MSKKPNLSAALHEASGKKQEVNSSIVNPGTPGIIQASVDKKPPSRIGKKVIAGHFEVAVVRQIKTLAINQDTSIQALLTEAINDLFEKNNLIPIA
jgi:hypothetical protein